MIAQKILVTGANGWLGSRLAESLLPEIADGARIRCLVLPGQNTDSLKKISGQIETISGDIRNPADCEKFCAGARDAILFHTAGIIHPRRVREFYEINRDGTANLLDAAIRAGARRAVIVSSNSPCGCNPHPDHLFDELSPYHPYFNYGRSKMEMELSIKQRGEKIEAVIIRAPWFYGPNQPPRQTLFFKMIRDGKMPIVGNGQNLRSMAYVDNLCQGLLLAAKSERANGQIYWIADKRPYSMNEIVDTVEKLLETEFGQKCAHKRLRLPGFASSIAYVADATLQSLGLYHQKIHVLSEMNKTIACSVAKAEHELNYRPTIDLEEGMRRSLQWCVEQGVKF
ncbi:MAG TPA: NAD(P)-dependent oxidoreductase [Dongiaceae bacterium]|jgi:nucleoside-diphosphate-sugar epimerase|nr:NAD(P)-dependent oxidoreductase [Dongiaceae bacterium]